MITVGVCVYVLNPSEKEVVQNEPVVTETPVATYSTYSELSPTETPEAKASEAQNGISEDSFYSNSDSVVAPSY